MLPLSEDETALLPTQEDVGFFWGHGYWFSPPIVPEEVLESAEEGMKRFYAGERDRELSGRDGTALSGWTPGQGEGVLRKNDYASLRVDELFRLVRQPLIAGCAARLLGVGGLRLWHDQLLYKPVDGPEVAASNVGWHTDRQYWLNCTSGDMITAWVPFHDVTTEAGAVCFLDGSHRWRSEELDFFNTADMSFWNQDLGFDGLPEGVRVVPAELRRGQVSFHHCKTIHGSGPNRADQPRRVLTIHLQPETNSYQNAVNPDGSTARHASDSLCRIVGGTPDYADPAWFPPLWPV